MNPKNRTIWTRKTEKFETKTQNKSRHNEIPKMMHMFNKYWSINCKKQLNELESIDFDFRYCHLWIKYSILSHLYLKMLQKTTKTNSKLVELVYRYLLELNKLIKLVWQFKYFVDFFCWFWLHSRERIISYWYRRMPSERIQLNNKHTYFNRNLFNIS